MTPRGRRFIPRRFRRIGLHVRPEVLLPLDARLQRDIAALTPPPIPFHRGLAGHVDLGVKRPTALARGPRCRASRAGPTRPCRLGAVGVMPAVAEEYPYRARECEVSGVDPEEEFEIRPDGRDTVGPYSRGSKSENCYDMLRACAS